MKNLILASLCLVTHLAFASSENKEFEAKGLTAILLENMSGKVVISSFEGPQAIVASTKNKFSDKCKMTIEKTGSKLVLKVEKSSGLFLSEECDIDFDIKVPKAIDLDIAVGSGDLTINGIQGSLTFKVGSGNVLADGLFKRIDGKLGTGKIELKGLLGGGELKTGSGKMDLTFAKSSLKGELDIKTGSGDVTVFFPKDSKVKTNFYAGSGQVSNELGDSSKALFVIMMNAGSGNLNIKSY